MRHPRQAFTREELLDQVWNWSFGDTSTVTVHVRRLREKLEPDPTLPRRIVTVWGVGYRYEPEATHDSVADLLDGQLHRRGRSRAVAAAGRAGRLRLLAARSVATSLTVVAAVTVVATLAGFVRHRHGDVHLRRATCDVVLAVVVIAGHRGLRRRPGAGPARRGGEPADARRGPGGGQRRRVPAAARPCSRPSWPGCPRSWTGAPAGSPRPGA